MESLEIGFSLGPMNLTLHQPSSLTQWALVGNGEFSRLFRTKKKEKSEHTYEFMSTRHFFPQARSIRVLLILGEKW